MSKDATRVRRRERKNIVSGVAHVNSTFNNTMITITDAQGNTISWSSAGTMGFKGSRKSTPFAAQTAAEDAVRKASEHGMRTLEVEVSGPGSGREVGPAARFRRPASTSPQFATSRRSRTTAADRASAAACNRVLRAGRFKARALPMRVSSTSAPTRPPMVEKEG